jgi:surface protein
MLANRVRMSQIKKGSPIPSYYVMAQDSDFSGTANGEFKYIGSHEYVIIPHVIKGVNVTSYREMFRENTSTTLKGVASDNLNITSMSYMFYQSQATTLDFSSFNTSNVNYMSYMFSNSQATTLDLSSFDTSSVTNMNYMFRDSRATTLDLSSFDTSSVTNMSYMFYGSQATTGYARTQADADKFNASNGKPSALVFVVK